MVTTDAGIPSKRTCRVTGSQQVLAWVGQYKRITKQLEGHGTTLPTRPSDMFYMFDAAQ